MQKQLETQISAILGPADASPERLEERIFRQRAARFIFRYF